jgi:UDP-glucose 4-epimerase
LEDEKNNSDRESLGSSSSLNRKTEVLWLAPGGLIIVIIPCIVRQSKTISFFSLVTLAYKVFYTIFVFKGMFVKKDKFILIVGGAGYIGSHINYLLNIKGYKTIVFDSLINGHKSFVKWGEFFHGDLCSIDQLRSVFKKYNISAVMHFAAFAYVGESVTNPQKYYINNVSNTLNLLSVMREFEVKEIIFSSTCATYGVPSTIPITELHPQNPINPYGKSKFMVERIIEDYSAAYGFRYSLLRYFNAAGAEPNAVIGEWHDPETHLIPLILDAAIDPTKEIQIFGQDYDTPDGSCIRDYIHVQDLANAHLLAMEYIVEEKDNQVFNLGVSTGYSVKEVINCAKEITGIGITVNDAPRRPGDPPILLGCADKANSVLGWQPRCSDMETIIETAWLWHRKLKRVN